MHFSDLESGTAWYFDDTILLHQKIAGDRENMISSFHSEL